MNLLVVTLFEAALGAQDPTAPAPQEWDPGDPRVRFVEGSRWRGIPPRGRWSGRASVHIRCTVVSNGRLEGCEVVAETPRGRISHSDARRAFADARLQMTEAGPQPGDRVTLEIVVTQEQRFR